MHYAPQDVLMPHGGRRYDGGGAVCDYRITYNRTNDPAEDKCRRCLRYLTRMGLLPSEQG